MYILTHNRGKHLGDGLQLVHFLEVGFHKLLLLQVLMQP